MISPGEYTVQFFPNLFGLRNSCVTEELYKSVWQELLIGITYNMKTLKAKQKFLKYIKQSDYKLKYLQRPRCNKQTKLKKNQVEIVCI